jgi:mannose-6-phosphate isomerase
LTNVFANSAEETIFTCMELNFTSDNSKEQVFEKVADMLADLRLQVVKHDFNRPWGGFFVIDESQADDFIGLFFPHLNKDDLMITEKLSPKILIVAPDSRLSWQYHNRRAEVWKVIGGHAGVVTSDTDDETELQHLATHDVVTLRQGERHRLIGLNEYGIVAEIWQHTDAQHPSDEDDIVRVQDDFGR